MPGGVVSNYLADTLKKGDVLELSAPAGQFVLPTVLPSKLLLISAGSGITPVMSMLRKLLDERDHSAHVQITFLHSHAAKSDLPASSRHRGEPSPRQGNLRKSSRDLERARGCSSCLLEQVEPAFRETETDLAPAGYEGGHADAASEAPTWQAALQRFTWLRSAPSSSSRSWCALPDRCLVALPGSTPILEQARTGGGSSPAASGRVAAGTVKDNGFVVDVTTASSRRGRGAV